MAVVAAVVSGLLRRRSRCTTAAGTQEVSLRPDYGLREHYNPTLIGFDAFVLSQHILGAAQKKTLHLGSAVQREQQAFGVTDFVRNETRGIQWSVRQKLLLWRRWYFAFDQYQSQISGCLFAVGGNRLAVWR